MNCEQVTPLLSALHDGELDAEERNAVLAHLSSCGSCSAYLDSIRSMSELATQLPAATPPPDLVEKVERALTEKNKSTLAERRPRRRRLLVMLVLGAAAMAAGLAVWPFLAGDAHHHEEMVRVFGQFLEAHERGQAHADEILPQHYGGKLVGLAAASEALHHSSLTKPTILGNHRVEKRYLLKMPCCDCVQTVYVRRGRKSLVIFEHEKEQPDWFQNRPLRRTECEGRPCCVVELKESLAASWRVGGRQVTAVGVRDLTELGRLMVELGAPGGTSL